MSTSANTPGYFVGFRRGLSSPLGAGIVATLLLLAITGLLSYGVYTVRLHDEYQETYNAAMDARDRLEIVLVHGLSATQTIALCVERGILPKEFDTVAPRIAQAYNAIDAVELTPGGIVSHVYPYEENKRAIGFNILTDSIQKSEALYAIKNRSLIFAGPLNLVQGGLAVVGRGPVFLQKNGEEYFWGFTIVIIRVSSLMKYAHFDELLAKGFAYRLSKRNPETGLEIPFFHADQQLEDPITVKVAVPKGEWALDVAPSDGWKSRAKTAPMIILSFLFSFLGGTFVWYKTRQPQRLQILVDRQTDNLLKSQKRLHDSLKEKDLLLKEIHHRVKNNLQVISSLLGIQSQSVLDPQAREAFSDSTRRIRSMAIVHEKLYSTGDLAQIDFQEYLNSVVHELDRSLHREGITLCVNADKIMLGIDLAIPCGLIANELVSNALKHAFPLRDRGSVVVSFTRVNNAMLRLEVQDDGVGIPAGKDFRSLNSMGMNIIRTLAEQILGTITHDGASGTRFAIEFPDPETVDEVL
jgi:two-component sensor histidine kinase/sensor domain CHASE-containing protein